MKRARPGSPSSFESPMFTSTQRPVQLSLSNDPANSFPSSISTMSTSFSSTLFATQIPYSLSSSALQSPDSGPPLSSLSNTELEPNGLKRVLTQIVRAHDDVERLRRIDELVSTCQQQSIWTEADLMSFYSVRFFIRNHLSSIPWYLMQVQDVPGLPKKKSMTLNYVNQHGRRRPNL